MRNVGTRPTRCCRPLPSRTRCAHRDLGRPRDFDDAVTSMTDSAEASTATTRPGRRGLGIAVTGCVLSGAVALFAVGRIWLHYTVPRSGLADLPSRATGHAVAGAAATLALVVLAGVVVLPATRGLGRRIAGAVIALAGLGMGYLAVLTIARTTDQLDVP